MLKRILVPLDGSTLSESILPYVIALAKGTGSEVELINVVSDPMMDVLGEAPVIWEEAPAIREAADNFARDYLSQKRGQLEGLGVNVKTTMEHGRASDEILRFAETNAPDLIAMSTHGRSGLRRMLLGSVSGQVLRGVATPLLLVRPRENTVEPVATLSDMIIPLDMSPSGEGVLPTAIGLAKVLDLNVTLVMALPNASQFYSGTEPVVYPSNFLERAEAAIRDYLEETSKRISKESDLSVGWEALRGDAGQAIVDYAKSVSNNLIAMSSHGRSAMGRLVLGSVSDRVIRTSGDPVLIVRPAS